MIISIHLSRFRQLAKPSCLLAPLRFEEFRGILSSCTVVVSWVCCIVEGNADSALYLGLSDRSMHTVLHALSHQCATLESLDLSGNPARMEPSWMLNLEHCSFLRKLNLSNLTRASSLEALIPTRVLSKWRLEELYFSGTSLNNESFVAIAEYLSSPESFSLKILDLESCNLHGHHASELLRSSVEQYQGTREMRVTLNGNRLEYGHHLFAEAIRHNQCPSQIVMQMVEYQDENNFRK